MSHLTQAIAFHSVPPALVQRPSLLTRLYCHFARINTAHARQARFASLTGEAPRDTGLCPEALLADSAFDQSLPFFFQRGFKG